MTLKELNIGESAVIETVGGQGALRQHFLDMGLIPGEKVTLVKFAPMGDPMELQIHGYALTLRLDDAAQINVSPAKTVRVVPAACPEQKVVEHPGLGEGGRYHTKKGENPLPDGTTLTFALAGNQNCGKTTLFNQLTGSNQHVGNFPGVTVDRKSGAIKGHPETEVTDLPGIYSMSPYSSEEIVTRQFLINEKPTGIINIVDATNIERNLYLTMQLMELDTPMVLALNMMDEVRGNGGTIRINQMEAMLGIPVVPISAAKNEGVDELVDHAIHVAKYQERPGRLDFCGEDDHGGAVHRCIHGIIHLIEDHAKTAGIPVRFAATKLVEGDHRIEEALQLDQNEKEMIEHIILQMEQERGLEESGIEGATIKRRVKSIYGIYRKTIMQNKSFDEIYDIYAVRVILDSLAECYSTLGLIHDMYHPLPNRFKDYISTPKPNGYQSLHTTVIGHEGIPFEVQIRTRKMDEQAEYGVAAHWKYKEGREGHDKLDDRLAWVSQLLENQRLSEDSGNLLHDLKSDLLPEEVFAFTPKGDVINLPTGATCIDFAYAIHSAVGNRMVGCKVNNRMVPIDHIVSTGEIIEVILGPADKGPSRDWLKIVRTSEAKSKIRNWFKKMRREENIQEGRDTLARELRREMIFIPDDELDEFIGSCCRRLRQNNAEELYAAIGYGGITIANCLPKLKEEWQKRKSEEGKNEQLAKVDLSKVHATDGVVVEGFDNTPIKFAKCCSPLPGDPIVGFITRGFGVSIHKQSCVNAISSMKDPTNAPRWVKAYWADSVKDSYKAGLEIVALDRNELLRDVLSALADIRVPIYTMNARQVENNCAVVSLTIGINNTEHLNRVVARLSKVRDVLKVTRS